MRATKNAAMGTPTVQLVVPAHVATTAAISAMPSSLQRKRRQACSSGSSHYYGQQQQPNGITACSSSDGGGGGSVAMAAPPGEEFFAGHDQRPIVLYDGICRMCNFWVNWVLRFEGRPTLRFAALQSPAGRALLRRAGRRPDDISSIVLVEADGALIKSEAVLRIALELRPPAPALAGAVRALLPLGLRDAAYDWVADNRYSLFGRLAACRLSDESCANRFLSD